MGSAVAIHLANNGHQVKLWGTKWDKEIIDDMKERKISKALDVKIPNNISFFYHNELEEALQGTKLIIIAVISKGMESISNNIANYITENHMILSVTKGIDENNLITMSEVIKNSLPEDLKNRIAIVKLGGPIIAKEFANGAYTEGVFGSENLESAKYVRDQFKNNKFKGNISKDSIGVDLCAAFKNSYAIAMGMIESVEKNKDNPAAALMARGAVEMANIIGAYGGSMETALGIAGVGDYYVTAQGGRNGQFGKLLGQGYSKKEALEIMENTTVEGITVTLNGYKLLQKLEAQGKINIKRDTPLFLEIYKVLYEGQSVNQAIQDYWASE